jgi:hypothetical protein
MILGELPGVTTARLGVAGVLQMVSKPTLVVSRVRTYDVWVIWEGHGMIHMLLIGCAVRV